MMKSHEITPTYLFSYLSFLLLPLVLQLRASARHCLVDCTGCSTRRGREGTPLAQHAARIHREASGGPRNAPIFVLVPESLTQPRRQPPIWDDERVMHTTRGVWPTACRPDVHPRELPRRRMRQTDTDKVFAVIHVVHGAEVLMRTHAWDIDFISSAVSRRRRIKLQHDAGVSPPAFDPIAATRFGSTTHRAALKGSKPKALRGDCAEGQLKLARGTPPSSKLARGRAIRRIAQEAWST